MFVVIEDGVNISIQTFDGLRTITTDGNRSIYVLGENSPECGNATTIYDLDIDGWTIRHNQCALLLVSKARAEDMGLDGRHIRGALIFIPRDATSIHRASVNCEEEGLTALPGYDDSPVFNVAFGGCLTYQRDSMLVRVSVGLDGTVTRSKTNVRDDVNILCNLLCGRIYDFPFWTSEVVVD